MSRGGGGGRATPGREYIVRRNADGEGQTLEDIGIAAYGQTGQGPVLWGANPHVSRTTKLPAGTKIIIPGIAPPVKLTGKSPDEVTCIIGGRVVPLMDTRILRTMDTGTDGWRGRIAWTPGLDPELDRITRPFGYERAAIYIGNELVVNGRLYVTEPSMGDDGITMGLIGYSFTADAIDSCVMPPYEVSGVTLKQLAEYYCKPLGISVYLSPELQKDKDFKAPFKTATAHEGERIFEHLAKLAAQRGALVTSTASGDLIFLRADTKSKPIGVLEEGKPPVTVWKATYDGRKRWHVYKCITVGVKGRGKTPQRWADMGKVQSGGKQLPSTVSEVDDGVPCSRFTTFRADEVTPGNVHHAARWRRNKTFADALTIQIPVSTWYGPDDKLWTPNTQVVVKSAVLRVPSGFSFLIREVEFELTDKGRTAVLHVLPPQAFSGKDLSDIWK